jgi:hypothetical protein
MERSARLPLLAGRPPWADDALLAAGLAAFGVVGTLGAADNQPSSRPPGALGWALLLGSCAAVALRRRHPVAVLAVTAAATAAWLAARYPYGPVFLPMCVATYTAAAAASRGRFPALAAGVGGLLVALVVIGVSDGRERLYDEVPNELPRVLLALGTCSGCRCGSAGRPGRGGSGPSRRDGGGPTRSGCGWPGSCTTWSRIPSP